LLPPLLLPLLLLLLLLQEYIMNKLQKQLEKLAGEKATLQRERTDLQRQTSELSAAVDKLNRDKVRHRVMYIAMLASILSGYLGEWNCTGWPHKSIERTNCLSLFSMHPAPQCCFGCCQLPSCLVRASSTCGDKRQKQCELYATSSCSQYTHNTTVSYDLKVTLENQKEME
jgi:hypothetical protein